MNAEPSPEIAETIDRVVRDGFCVVPDAISAERVAALQEAVARTMIETGVAYGSNDFLGLRTRRIFNLLARDPIFETLPLEPAWLPVAEAILDPECLLSSLTAIQMEPGETDQPIHADDGSVPLPKPHVPTALVALVALTDFTERNGGTRVVPGSHLRDRSPRRGDTHDTVAIEMSAGSALVYNGSLWHGGGANRSDSARIGIVCNYCAGFMRQEECQLLALPQERVATFAPRLQRLVGYGTYRGLLGHVDQQDPAARFDPDLETRMVWSRIRK